MLHIKCSVKLNGLAGEAAYLKERLRVLLPVTDPSARARRIRIDNWPFHLSQLLVRGDVACRDGIQVDNLRPIGNPLLELPLHREQAD
jgi:hypothetical protein